MKKNMKKKAWPHFQGRNRDSDIEDGLVDTAGEGEAGTGRIERVALIYISAMNALIHFTMFKIDS